ncbi:hypothetical protein [Coxiella-like endosymbiont]
MLTPPLKFSLELDLQFVTDDELLEVMLQVIYLHKKFLKKYEQQHWSVK